MRDNVEKFGPYGKLKWGLSIAWLLAIVTVAFLNNLGNIGLMDKTEAMFVEAAREMVDSGDWVTPYWNGETRFDKPPLTYWLISSGFKLFGMNEWTARLPSALSAIALTILGFYTLLCFGNRYPQFGAVEKGASGGPDKGMFWKSAWIGVPVLALNPSWIAWGRTGVSDMLLAANVGLAMFSFFMGYARRDPDKPENAKKSDRWYLLFYVFTALAVLAKGPVGAVLPAMGIILFLLYLGNFKQVFLETRPLRGILVSLAVAFPWFVLVTLANGEAYINSFFGHHNFERFTSVVSNHYGPWYFYFPVVIGGLFPWSIYLPLAVWRLYFWRRRHWRATPRSFQLGLFAFCWFFSTFLFFSVSVTKLPSYVLPLMPAGAILIALMFGDLMARKQDREGKGKNAGIFISALLNVLLLLLVAVGTLLAVRSMGYDPYMPNLKKDLVSVGLPAWNALIWGTGAVAGIYLLFGRQRWRWLWTANMGVMMAFMFFIVPSASAIFDTERQLPLRQLSHLVSQVQKPGERLVVIGPIKPSIGFYTRQTLDYVDTCAEAFDRIKQGIDNGSSESFLMIFDKIRESKGVALGQLSRHLLGTAGTYELVRITGPPAIGHAKKSPKSAGEG